MKQKRMIRRVFAGFLAAIMVFMNVDAGCISALADEIQNNQNLVDISSNMPTGYRDMQLVPISEQSFEGEIFDCSDIVESQSYSLAYNSEWDKFSTNFYYNKMSEKWRIAWDALDAICLAAINSEMDAYSTDINKPDGSGVATYYYFDMVSLPEKILYQIDENGYANDEVYELINFLQTFISSNPQYYFLNGTFLQGVEEIDGVKYITGISLCVYQKFSSGVYRNTVSNKLLAKINNALENVEGKSDDISLQILHDYVIRDVEYNHAVLDDEISPEEIDDAEEEEWLTQSIYSTFLGDYTVCTGYSKALSLLCNAIGIDAINVISSDHMWNKVRINDCWYNVDATWGDAGENSSINYDYFGRSDAVYYNDTNKNVISHTPLNYWEQFIPKCMYDGKDGFATVTNTLPAPVIKFTKNDNGKYNVVISIPNSNENEVLPNDMLIYYTVDGTEPSVASTKSYIYSKQFEVDAETQVKAIVISDDKFMDSDVSIRSKSNNVKNALINDHFYHKMILQWDKVEDASGYILQIYQGDEILESNKIKTITFENKDICSYELDTSMLDPGTKVFYEIVAYYNNGESIEYSEKTYSPKVTTKAQPLKAKVQWHVTTINNVQYLVIDVEEIANDGLPKANLLLWYYKDIQEIEPLYVFKVDMTNGNTRFMYTLAEHGVSYEDNGYFYITNEDKTSAFQDSPFAVGGEYVELEILPIEDKVPSVAGETITLKVEFAEDSIMENFHYKYQWYVATEEGVPGTKIEGATKDTYQTQIGSYYEKYYYCEVTIEYEEKVVASTGYIRVSGELFGTEIKIEPIEDVEYTGQAICPELIVVDRNTGKVLEYNVDYTVVYTDNINVKNDVVGTVTYIGDYSNAPTAYVYFNIVPKSAETLEVYSVDNVVYTGMAFNPRGIIKDLEIDEILVEGRDYTITFGENTNAGTATITIDFMGNYTGTRYVNFKIIPRVISDGEVTITNNVNHVYSASEIIPDLILTFEYKTLIKGVDYVLECKNNTNVGTANVKIKYIGNYSGEDQIEFTITQKPADSTWIKDIESMPYTGSAITPSFEVSFTSGGRLVTLVENTDYIISYVNSNNISVGTVTATFKFIGNYSGELTKTFDIVKCPVDNLYFEDIPNFTYTGEAICPPLVIKNGNIALVEGEDYDLEYANNVLASTDTVKATVTATFKGNYVGEKVLTYVIDPKPATNCVVTLDLEDEYIYKGQAFVPSVEVKDGETVLVKDTDYTVDYEDNTNAGTAYVIVTFIGNYTGQTTKEFIILPITVTDAVIDPIEDVVFNGTAYVPQVHVTALNGTLEFNPQTDYEVTITDNVNAGTATVTVRFKGNYVGTVTTQFSILRKTINLEEFEIFGVGDKIYTGSEIKLNLLVRDKEISYYLENGVDYVLTYIDNVFEGVASVIIDFSIDTGNFISDIIKLDFNILAKDTEGITVSTIYDQIYTGSEIRPVIEVKDGNLVLVEGRDYSLVYENNIYPSNNAKVIVHFLKNYTGEDKVITFTILNPIPESITSSAYSINESTGYISKISVGTSVNSFWSALNEKDYIAIFDKNGSNVSGDQVLGTGMKASIVDEGTAKKTYTIVVTGDTNGDGKINITDMIAVKASTLKKSDLSGAYEKAGDVNGDGKINITDFIKVKATILNKDTITGVTVQ